MKIIRTVLAAVAPHASPTGASITASRRYTSTAVQTLMILARSIRCNQTNSRSFIRLSSAYKCKVSIKTTLNAYDSNIQQNWRLHLKPIPRPVERGERGESFPGPRDVWGAPLSLKNTENGVPDGFFLT